VTELVEEVVSVTKKGQATIPKRLRDKYRIKGKVLIVEEEGKIVLKPIPTPEQEFGSLKTIFKGKNSRELLEAARREESAKDEERRRRVGATGLRL